MLCHFPAVIFKKAIEPLWVGRRKKRASVCKTLIHNRSLSSMFFSLAFISGFQLWLHITIKKKKYSESFLWRVGFNWSRVQAGHEQGDFENFPWGKSKVKLRLKTICLNWVQCLKGVSKWWNNRIADLLGPRYQNQESGNADVPSSIQGKDTEILHPSAECPPGEPIYAAEGKDWLVVLS